MSKQFLVIHMTDETGSPLTQDVDKRMLEAWLADGDDRIGPGSMVAGADQAKSVTVRDGEVLITDGPFPEFREWFAGYDLISAESIDDAAALMAKHPTAPQGRILVLPAVDLPWEQETAPPSAEVLDAGSPPIVDMATWEASRAELLVREKAHTREGDAVAAARRRLPMVEIDGATPVVGPDGPVPFLTLFGEREELLVYKHMWHDGAPHQGQCEGCTLFAWHLRDSAYLTARGVAFAVLCEGPWDEIAPFRDFMGYSEPWYSVRGLDAPIGGEMGRISVFLRRGDRVFLTYDTTGRGTEAASGSFALLDMTPYGRREAWQDTPEGWPEGTHPCWYWRTDDAGVGGHGPTSRPVPQWGRPGATPVTEQGRAHHH